MTRFTRHLLSTSAGDRLGTRRKLPSFVMLVAVALSLAVVWMVPLPAAAQFDDVFSSSPSAAGPDWLSLWYVKAGLVLIAFLAALLFCFLVVFQWLLTKSRPWWPKSAYGFCMARVLTVTFGIALAMFWNDLAFGGGSGPRSSLEVWGGRGVLIGIWLFLVILALVVFRSPHAREEAKAARQAAPAKPGI